MNKNKVLNQNGASLIEIIMSVGILSAALSYFMIQSNMSFKITQKSKKSRMAQMTVENIANVISTMSTADLLKLINDEKISGKDLGVFYLESSQTWLQKWIENSPYISSIKFKVEVFKHESTTPLNMKGLEDERDLHLTKFFPGLSTPDTATKDEMLLSVFEEYHKKITVILCQKGKECTTNTAATDFNTATNWSLGE